VRHQISCCSLLEILFMCWCSTVPLVLFGVQAWCVWVALWRRNQLGRLFSSELDVVMLTAQAVPPLAVSLIGEDCMSSRGVFVLRACVMHGCGRDRSGGGWQRAGRSDAQSTGSATTRGVTNR
jgi:hypothetical protein